MFARPRKTVLPKARRPVLGAFVSVRCGYVAALMVCALSIGSACDRATRTCEQVGVCDEPAKPAELVDLVCDASQWSSCNATTLPKTLDIALQRLADRPGSRIRLWFLGETAANTSIVGEQTIAPIPRGNERARKAKLAAILSTAKEMLLAGARERLEAPPVRRSPLAEAIAKIALAESGGLPRRLILVTDAREVTSDNDFECRLLPSDAQFLAALRRRSIFLPGQLAGIDVSLTYVVTSPAAGRGCPITLERDMRVRALWKSALTAANASHVRITSGPVDFADTNEPPAPIDGGLK